MPGALEAVRAAVSDGERAAARELWLEAGTADLRFHQALAGLLGSPRIDELMRGVLAELRLVFHVMPSRQHFHQAYLARNREIFELIEAGNLSAAEDALAVYLDDAEHELVDAYREHDGIAESMGEAGKAPSR
jgi:DNA-binding GntR family transcriptional regulator